MKMLGIYIKELLFKHQVIAIEGLGSLICHRTAAQVNGATQMFLPPARKVAFQPDLNGGNKLLPIHISRSEKITLEEAEHKIQYQVAQMVDQLRQGERVKWDGIGIFYSEPNGKIAFKASVDQNFDPNYYGLGIFRAPSIQPEARTIPISETIRQTASERKLNKGWWQAAAVLLPVAGLLYMGSQKADWNLHMDGMASFNPLFFAQTNPDHVLSNEELAKEEVIDKVVEDESPSEENITPVEESAPRTPVFAETSAPGYYVVVGSFTEEENAHSLAAVLKARGFEPEIIRDNTRFTKVSLFSSQKKAEATHQLNLLKKQINSGAWVYHL